VSFVAQVSATATEPSERQKERNCLLHLKSDQLKAYNFLGNKKKVVARLLS
jgi:hypothetical protein